MQTIYSDVCELRQDRVQPDIVPDTDDSDGDDDDEDGDGALTSEGDGNGDSEEGGCVMQCACHGPCFLFMFTNFRLLFMFDVSVYRFRLLFSVYCFQLEQRSSGQRRGFPSAE